MIQQKNIDIDILDTLRQKWYWVSIPLFTFLMLGAWVYVVLPRAYEASTLILVQPQEIPSAYVQSTVSSGIEERVRTLSQEVMSRSNLESIIKDLDLYHDLQVKNVPMDIIIEQMRKKIDVSTRGGLRGQTSSFTISYRGRDPVVVAEVTNKLAAFFIESNLRLRARQAAQTTLFLEKQLEDLKRLLQEQEHKVEEYRNQYMGELPEQLQSNISTITGLQVRLEALQVSLTDAMNRRLLLQRQLSQIESDQPGATLSRRGQRLGELEAQLEELRTLYTGEHPAIRRLEEQIADLRRQPEETAVSIVDPQVMELKNQLETIDIEIVALRSDMERIKERIEFYQARVENTPKREQEISALTRDYDITRQNYQRLLDRLYEAKRAESMEIRQQGEQFRVLDFARSPETPVSPDRNRIALIFLALGLGTGAGVIFLMEILDNSVKSIKQLENLTQDIVCISAIPLAPTQQDIRKGRIKNALMLTLNIVIIGAGLALVVQAKLNHVVVNIPLPF